VHSLLVLAFESMVVALDLQTGQTVWEFDPDGYIMDTRFIGGLLCMITLPIESEASQDIMVAQTLNPVTGEPFWRHEVVYSSHARIIPSDDVFCVSSISNDRRSEMTIFDPFTGICDAAGGRIALEDRIITPLPFKSPEGMVLIIASQQPGQGSGGVRVRFLEAYSTDTHALMWSVCLDSWLVPVNAFMLAEDMIAMYTREREGLRGQKTLVLINLQSGEIVERLRFGDDSALLPDSGLLRNDSLVLRGSSVARNLVLSSLDFNTLDFHFKDLPFLIGDSNTLNAIIRNTVYADNGVVIPMDFSLRSGKGKMLWSQVLFVEAQNGRLLYALDVFWKDSNRIPNLAIEQYPVEVVVRDDAVLVLKHSMLYVVRGASTGG
ncbi:MAG: hypothetical protein ABIK28_20425, partial [Planctomycetota bacterium]